jgi:ketosteroid isomerase-like protein
MTAIDTADRYFACIRAKDIDGLLDLYAEDATFILPNSRELSGNGAIGEMHQSVLAAGAPLPNPVRKIATANDIAVEIRADLPDGSARHTANFFHLNAQGQIARLAVYMRGG